MTGARKQPVCSRCSRTGHAARSPTCPLMPSSELRIPRKRQRWWGTHPVTGARITISARTAGELAELVARVRYITHEYRVGRLTSGDASNDLALVQQGKPPRARGAALTFGDAWRAYEETIVHPHARSKLRGVWKLHLAELDKEPVTAFNNGRLDALIAGWTAKGLSPRTVRHTLWAFLSAAIRYAHRSRWIERLPWDNFQPPRAPVRRRPAAATELADFAALVALARGDDALDEEKGRLGDLARRILVLGLCGLRNGEGAGLGWDRIDFDADTITIDCQAIDQWQRYFPDKARPDFPVKNPRESGPLVQRLHPDARAALLEQREALRARGWYRPDGPVFPTRDGSWRKNANCIYPEDMKTLAVRAGIPNAARWVTHSLRHSTATLELLHGGAPRIVQRRIGHASLRMLEQYAHGGDGGPSAIPRVPQGTGKSASRSVGNDPSSPPRTPPAPRAERSSDVADALARISAGLDLLTREFKAVAEAVATHDAADDAESGERVLASNEKTARGY